ncbi:MAG: DUF3006 domain-containing protein [Clostridia bacterium]|nr:DUF3006 domain-containing protein [Clostridia bacterium]
MKKLIVDRIEDGFAVCENENGEMIELDFFYLPYGAKEGSVLVENNGLYELCPEEENERREKLFNLQESLFDE